MSGDARVRGIEGREQECVKRGRERECVGTGREKVTHVFAGSRVFFSWVDMPKSAILNTPSSLTRMFDGLTSLAGEEEAEKAGKEGAGEGGKARTGLGIDGLPGRGVTLDLPT